MALLRGSPDVSPVLEQVERFWARGPGSIEECLAIEKSIRDAKITAQQIRREILPRVPGVTAGTTGERCSRVASMLRRVADSI